MQLANDDVELVINPEIGGSVAAFRWQGKPIFRDTPDHERHVLGFANYPLVPYSNRIAYARFGDFRTAPNCPENEPLHSIHGTGFLAAWDVTGKGALRHIYDGPDWPGPYTAHQRFELHDDGYTHHIGIRNDGNLPIPAGLGLHPHFPRAEADIDITLAGIWINGKDRIPYAHQPLTTIPEWFGNSLIDNGFTGRSGDICIHWPTHSLMIQPDDDLSHTVIYCPPGAEYFCIEPVTHMIDAANRTGADAMRMVQPGESWAVKTRFRVRARD